MALPSIENIQVRLPGTACLGDLETCGSRCHHRADLSLAEETSSITNHVTWNTGRQVGTTHVADVKTIDACRAFDARKHGEAAKSSFPAALQNHDDWNK